MGKTKEELVSQLVSMSKILESQVNIIFDKERELILLKTKFNELVLKTGKKKFDRPTQTEQENNFKNKIDINPKIHGELLEELIKISNDNKILKRKLLNKVKNNSSKKNKEDYEKKYFVVEKKYEKIKNENINLMALIKKSEYNTINDMKTKKEKLSKKNKKLKKTNDFLKKEKIILQKSFSEFLVNIDNLKNEINNK